MWGFQGSPLCFDLLLGFGSRYGSRRNFRNVQRHVSVVGKDDLATQNHDAAELAEEPVWSNLQAPLIDWHAERPSSRLHQPSNGERNHHENESKCFEPIVSTNHALAV